MTTQNNQTKVKEIWVPCKFINKNGTLEEYPEYEVSNFGRIRSLNYNHAGKSKVLKHCPKVQSNGTYYEVCLCRCKKRYWRRVHRLVLSSFGSKGYFKGAVVDHADSDPSNNNLSNLHWITQQENCSTSHRSEALSKVMTNHPSFSKQVQVTFLDDNHIEIFPSAMEAERSLGMPKNTVTPHIHQLNGFYKKLNLLFEYI